MFFSVIIPFKDRLHLLQRTIDSLANQIFKDFEVILIDDGSVSNINLNYYNLEFRNYKNSENRGVSYSRNFGAIQSKSDWIVFLDSDDELLPNFLLIVKEEIINNENNDCGLFWTGRIYDNGKNIKNEIWIPKNTNLIFDLHVGASGLVFCRKKFLSLGGFDEYLKSAEDTDLLIRYSKLFAFKVIEKELIKINLDSGGNSSKSFSHTYSSYVKIYSNNKEEIQNSLFLSKKYIYKLMWLAYYNKDFYSARNYYSELKSKKLINKKIYFVKIIFELFGSEMGNKIHRFLGKNIKA